MRHVPIALALAALPLLSAAQAPGEPAPAPSQTWQRPASGAASTSSRYFFAKLGVTMPQSDDLDGFDNGLALEGGVGFPLAPNMALEVSIGRFATGFEESAYDPYYGDMSYEVTASAIPISGSVKFFGRTGSMELYGLVGLGLYMLSLDEEYQDAFGSESASESDTSIGLHFGGGFSAAVSPTVSLGLELKYLVAQGTFYDTDVSLNSVILTGGLAFRF